uniref:Putative regulation of transcription n=1 Tax=Ixodes ricinus TaxID=34613 RepID=A0A6B0VDM1_IXORI
MMNPQEEPWKSTDCLPADQFEPLVLRNTGLKRPKQNAVPAIFNYQPAPMGIKPTFKRKEVLQDAQSVTSGQLPTMNIAATSSHAEATPLTCGQSPTEKPAISSHTDTQSTRRGRPPTVKHAIGSQADALSPTRGKLPIVYQLISSHANALSPMCGKSPTVNKVIGSRANALSPACGEPPTVNQATGKKRSGPGRSGQTCCIPGCGKNDTRNKEVSWHNFPADVELKKQWVTQINQAFPGPSWWEPKPSNKICGDHFNASGRRRYEDKIPRFFPTSPDAEAPRASNLFTAAIQQPLVVVSVPKEEGRKRTWLGHSRQTCCVQGCRNSDRRKKNEELSWHKFPSDIELRKKWITEINRALPEGQPWWEPKASSRICGAHFNTGGRKKYEDKIPRFFPPKMNPESSKAPRNPAQLFEDLDHVPSILGVPSGEQGFVQSAAVHGDGNTPLGSTSFLLKVTEDVLFRCCFCAHVTTERRGIVSHLVSHDDEHPSECQYRPTSFGSTSILRHHIQKRARDRSLKSSGSIQACKDEHQQSPEAFTQNSGVTNRVPVQTSDEKSYRCELCPKTFAVYDSLALHRQTHGGQKPHRCKFCPQAFVQLTNLIDHMCTHTNKKP